MINSILYPKKIISKIKEGDVVQGIVKNLTEWGVFVDLNGVDAFALKLLDDIKYRREEDIKYLLKLKGEFNSGTQSIKESTD